MLDSAINNKQLNFGNGTISNMTIKRTVINIILVLVFFGKSLVPAGYMLNSFEGGDAFSYLSLCPLQNNGLHLDALFGAQENHHAHHGDPFPSPLDPSPSNSYGSISGISECVLWQGTGSFALVTSFASQGIPVNELSVSPFLLSPFPRFGFYCDGARAPPFSLS